MFYNARIVNGYKQPSSWTRQILYPGNRGSYHFALLDTRLDTTYTGAHCLYSTLDTFVSVSTSQPTNEAVRYELNKQSLLVEAKVFGRVEEIGTVNSVQLLWQILFISMINQAKPLLQRSALDPVLSALAETLIKLTWRSHIRQILVSVRIASRTPGEFDVIAYATSAYTSHTYFTPRAFQFLCSWITTVASCPCDGARMRLVSGFKIQPMLETNAISQAFGVFLKGRSYINQNMWRQSAGDVVFITGGLLGVSRLDSRDLVRNKLSRH